MTRKNIQSHVKCQRSHVPRSGFTLIELLVFTGIFTLIIIGFLSVFVSVIRIQVRQYAAAEVHSQSQFLLQKIQYYVERSSLVDFAADTTTSTLKLRMASSTEDPLYIRLSNQKVEMKQTDSGSWMVLTSDKVRITNLQFVKRTNAPGKDSVAVNFTMEFAGTAKQQFIQMLDTSVARVSAATFDSDILPSGSSQNIGLSSGGTWNSINQTIYFSGSNVGIGIPVPASARLHVSGGNIRVTSGDVYVDTATNGLILKRPDGTACYRVTITNGGAFSTSSIACP